MVVQLAAVPAGASSRYDAPTVGPLSLSVPTSSAAFTEGFTVNGMNFSRLGWWRYECPPEADQTQVWFDGMRSTNPDGSECWVGLLVFNEDGTVHGVSTNGYDPVDGFVRRGAIMSPVLRTGEAVYIGFGAYEADAPEALYRLRVSAPSEMREWVQMPDRDGLDSLVFQPEEVPYEVDPEQPYLPRPSYYEGFRSAPEWFGNAQVHDHKVSRVSPPLPGYTGGGPYDNIFETGAAKTCVQDHAMRDGRWNSEGLQWGIYWNDYCPPMVAPTLRTGSQSSNAVMVSMRLERTAITITDDDSISATYRAPAVAFNLHEAQEAIGPSGGWLLHQQMKDELIEAEGRSVDIVWENDQSEIISVTAWRRFGAMSTPTGAKLDAKWRGGPARDLLPSEAQPWGPYVELTDPAHNFYEINQHGSGAGPSKLTSYGEVGVGGVGDHGDPTFPVPDWRAGYDFEEARAYDLDDGTRTYPAPGLVFIAAPDSFDSLGEIDVPVGQAKTLEASITGVGLTYRIGVRPSRFRFRFAPEITPVDAPPPAPTLIAPAIDGDLLLAGQRFNRPGGHD